MELIQLDDAGRLFLSPDIDDWTEIDSRGISVIIDTDGGLDANVPLKHDHILYLYYPFNDAGLPDLSKLHAVARFAAELVRSDHKVLAHCAMGFNRSALVAALILRYLGCTGPDAIARLQQYRPGALFNEIYAIHVQTGELL